MASEMYVDTIAASDGTSPATLTKQSAPKGFVQFNAIGTLAVNNSFNISSVTDSATGKHVNNFTNAFSDANFVSSAQQSDAGSNSNAQYIIAHDNTSSSVAFWNVYTGAYRDDGAVQGIFVGDLA